MSFNPVRKAQLVAVFGALAIALALVPGARSGSIPQLLNLGPITVLNGTAIVSGTVGGAGAGSQLTVNGHPLSLDAAGNFAGVVGLDGASTVDLSIGNSSGQLVDFHVPVALRRSRWDHPRLRPRRRQAGRRDAARACGRASSPASH